jgi:hypothetical protein
MKKIFLLCLFALLAFPACDDDPVTTTADGQVAGDAAVTADAPVPRDAPVTGDAPTTGDGPAGFPAAPAVGAQIDRMGRPGVNTALTDPFEFNGVMMADTNKNTYNANADPATWRAAFAPAFARALAVIDGLDRNCGNQLLAANPTMPATPTRYATLAGALADDRLYVNTATSTCSVYLAVEANATGIIPNMDCGGRKLEYDVIDTTYSVLAIGSPSGVTDGVANDSTFLMSWPFLAAPNP